MTDDKLDAEKIVDIVYKFLQQFGYKDDLRLASVRKSHRDMTTHNGWVVWMRYGKFGAMLTIIISGEGKIISIS